MSAVFKARLVLVSGMLMLGAPAQALPVGNAVSPGTCYASRLQVGNLLCDNVGPAGSYHSDFRDDYGGLGDASYLNWGDSLALDITPGRAAGTGALAVRGSFRVMPAQGGAFPLRLQMRVAGSSFTQGSFGCNIQASATLQVSFSPVTQRAWHGSGFDPFCNLTLNDTLEAVVNVTPGIEYPIEQDLNISCRDIVGGQLKIGSSLWYGNLPPGSFVVACDGSSTTHVLAVGGSGVASGLALEHVWPNPARGEIHASCVLPRGGPAILRLLDAAGRVVDSRVLDASEATRREVTLGGRLAPGTYFLQVSQGAISDARSVTIVR